MIDERGLPRPMVRMKHPREPGLYYRHGSEPPWVKTGYTTWSRAAWLKTFGGLENDTRIWDFFGETIELWPPGSEDN